MQTNALIIHLNPLQELIQSNGDRDWNYVLETIENCAARLEVPVIVKEVGSGIGPSSAKKSALVPRPRHNLVRYHGVLARGCRQPNARMRKLVVPTKYKRNKAKIDRSKCESVTKSDEADKLFAPLT
ncbi:MAG: hypothetical protein ACJAVI_003861 [Candidatus Azotimanducaceae bacterium]